MCCGGNTSTSTTTNNPGPITLGLSKAAADRALQINKQTYPGYDWRQRTAPMNAQQTRAFGSINDLSDTKILDEEGPLGKMSGYMDPFMRGVLDPTIREIRESGTAARRDISDQAQFGGAYGDARHGVAEGVQRGEEQKNIGDATGAAYSTAWNSGVNLRQTDLQNLMSGALARLGIGDRQQAQDQAGKDAKYSEFATAREWSMRQLDALLSFITGQPASQSTATTTEGPNNWLSKLLGAGTGALLGGARA